MIRYLIHCNQQRISVHDVISIVEKKKLAAGDIALNDLEECNSKIGSTGLENSEASSVGHEPKLWEENSSAREYLENNFET